MMSCADLRGAFDRLIRYLRVEDSNPLVRAS